MPRGRYKKADSGQVNLILSALAEGLTTNEILRRTGVSTTVFYKVIADYPLWSYYLKKEDPNA